MQIDHIVISVPDLATIMAEIKEELGCEAVIGGKHTKFGTHNALLGIKTNDDSKCYIEFLASDPDVEVSQRQYPFGLFENVPRPTITAWAASCDDIEMVASELQQLGSFYDCGEVFNASRAKPDGSEICWQIAFKNETLQNNHGVSPFILKWRDAHPVDGLAPQNFCELKSFEISALGGDEIQGNLSKLGLKEQLITANENVIFKVILANNGKTMEFVGR